MILSRPGHCLLSGTNLSKLSRADHQRSGQAKKTEFHIPDGVSTVVSGNSVCVWLCRWSCSKSRWRLPGLPRWAGGRGTSCAGSWSSSGIRCHPLSSHHRDQGLLQDIRLLRFGIHPHRHLLGQVSPPSSCHHHSTMNIKDEDFNCLIGTVILSKSRRSFFVSPFSQKIKYKISSGCNFRQKSLQSWLYLKFGWYIHV